MKGRLVSSKNSQSGSGHLIIVIILVVTLLGTLGFVFWQNYTKSKTGNTSTTNSLNNRAVKPNDSPNTTATIVPNAAAIITDAYNLVNSKYASSALKIESTLGVANSPVYKPSGAKYNITTNGASSLYIAHTDQTSMDDINLAILNSVHSFLTNNKFIENKTTGCGLGNMACYYSPNVICGSTGDGSGYKLSFFSLSCADISDFTPALSVIEPFAQAYLSAYPEYLDTSFGVPKIKNSLVVGYQYAEVLIGQAADGLFYKKDGGSWEYFMSIQGNICSIFNTAELKAAFSGFRCTDSTGKTISLTQDY